MALPPVGCQLIVFGKQNQANPDAVLDCVAAAGYAAVEGGGGDPHEYRRKLDARGLKAGGMHTGLKRLQENLPSIIDRLNVLGCTDLSNSGLFVWDERSLADWKAAVKVLNDAGRTLRSEGVHLHYHNHAFEFSEKIDGERTAMDLLLDELNFDVVDFCIDVGWVKVAGADPAAFLLEHKDRIGYLHLKDHDGATWAELGRGNVDWPSVMAVLPQLDGVRWAMIEQDSTQIDPCESATISRRYLQETFNY
ncbi:MAG: sugar phosphate isomerase/epimerase [Phycisphaeraceae bacterium]